MRRRNARLSVRVLRVIAPVCLVAALLPVAASAASPGPGTFTKITTPKKDLVYREVAGATNTVHVAGRTSSDVTSVDVDCITALYDGKPDVAVLASGVAVTSGAFSVDGTIPSDTPATCRLRAIPSGTDLADGAYFSSYTGPILYVDAFVLTKAGSTPYAYSAFVDERDGAALLTDAGACGVEALVPVDPAGPQAGPVMLSCAYGLPSANVTSGAPTASGIQVGGQNAYLPSAVHTFLIDGQGLAVTQTALTASMKIAANGDITITESEPLVRCSVSNTYPPTTTSCPHLTSTGVKLSRVTTVFRDGEQAKVRDAFISTDHKAHALRLQYSGVAGVFTGSGSATGLVGYTYPGHGHTFKAAPAGQKITGVGAKTGTMFIRSDLYATSDDPDNYTVGATWSRGPSAIKFSGTTPNQFGMAYSLSVPSGGGVHLGFALSARLSTAATTRLATAAGRDMLPRVTAGGSSDNSRGQATESGKVTAGANGLPVSVTVNGHAAKVTVTSATTERFSVHFHLPSTTHRIKTVLRDVAGNTSATSEKV